MKNSFFVLLMALLLGSLASISFQINSLFSFLQYIIIISGAFLVVATLKHKSIGKEVLLCILYIFLILVYSIFSTIDYQLFITIVMYILMLSAFISYRNFLYNDKLLLFAFVFLAIELFFLSTTGNAYRATRNLGELGGQSYIGDSLTFGFNNPNEAGIVLYYSISYLLTLFWGSPRSRTKLVLILSIVTLLVVLLFKTNCRSCVFSLFFSITFFFLYKKRLSQNKKIGKLIILLLLIMPLVFSFLYPVAALRWANTDIEIFGKSIFSGRELLFVKQFSRFLSSPLLGDISYFQFSNSLNGYLTIMFNTGVIGFVFYFVIVSRSILKLSEHIITRQQLYAFSALMGIFQIACTESVVLVGGGRWFLLFIFLLMLADKPVFR